MTAFNHEDIEVLARAYTRAWRDLLRTADLTPRNVAACRKKIARSICDMAAADGLRDESRLSLHAVRTLPVRRYSGC